MSTSEMTLFFVMLAAFGFAAIVAALLIGIIRLVTGETPAIVDTVRPYALAIAFLAATVSMLGSLYYSEIAGFRPCKLCWYQRYMMYPSSILLGLALLTKRMLWAKIALGLSVVGLGISTYHRLEQQFPASVGGACDLDNPCSGRYVNEFDFVTIPTMAWVGFGLVIVFTTLALATARTAKADLESVTSNATLQENL